MNLFVNNLFQRKLCMSIIFRIFVVKINLLQKNYQYAQLLCKVRNNS